MPGTGSYERGDSPRSVPDPLDADMRRMEAQQRAYNQRQEADAARRRDASRSDAPASPSTDYWSKHPGTLESLVPVWGSAREAVADWREGDEVGAALNGLAAVTDLAGGTVLVKGLVKGGVKVGGSHAWRATRDWMGKKGVLRKGQPGHHWLAEQNDGWGKYVPDAIKNQPWNVKGMPSDHVHIRFRGAHDGQPKFNAAQRFWYGTPTWWKAGVATVPPHAATTIQEGVNPAARDDRGPRSSPKR